MQTKKDQSYGVIPVRHTDAGWEVFLIHQISKIGNNTYWAIPKGHPEPKETPPETATRELKEETGLEVAKLLETPTFSRQYSFQYEGVKIEKTVRFFIGIITGGEATLQTEEVKEGGWYSLDDAADRLDHQQMKEMWAEARAFIETLPVDDI